MLQVEVVRDEILGKRVEHRGVARRIGAAHVVDRFDQPAAEQVSHVTIDDRAGEELVLGVGQPIGKRQSSIERVIDRFATRAVSAAVVVRFEDA